MPEETTSTVQRNDHNEQRDTRERHGSERDARDGAKMARSYVPPHMRRQLEQQLRVGAAATERPQPFQGNGAPEGRAASSGGFFRSGSGASRGGSSFGGGVMGARERGTGSAAPGGGRRWGAAPTGPGHQSGASSRLQRLGLWEETNPYYSSGLGKPQEQDHAAADANGEVLELFNGQNTGINFDKYDDIPVEVSGENVVPEIMSFETSGMDKILLRNVALSGYRKPTPVQRHAIPTVMAGRDLMSCAQTGSGKTAAFVLPVLHQMLLMGGPAPPPSSSGVGGISSRSRCSYPTYLILAPTRELASQIFSECRKFCYGTSIRAAVIYGGSENTREQLRAVENQVDIVVATPGRLLDFIDRGRIHLANVRFLTLDEADRMLDMGFEPQIRQIVENCDMPAAGQRQTLMFSATFPREIQRLASDFLHDYIFLAVGRVGSTTDFIVQRIEFCEDHLKREMLLDLLNSIPGLTLVFVDTKRAADALEDFLLRHGYAASSIHGDRSQREREDSLAAFRSGQTPILVATDVAARGLDIPNVAHVVNYELPAAIDDYVHRIGRTGRAGNQGIATSFANEKNRGIVRDLIELLQEAGQEVPSWLYTMCQAPVARSGSGRAGRGGRFGGRDMRRETGAPRRPAFAGNASSTSTMRDEPWGGGNWRASGGSAW
jgi:superfamily II DNA/RNA helicase